MSPPLAAATQLGPQCVKIKEANIVICSTSRKVIIPAKGEDSGRSFAAATSPYTSRTSCAGTYPRVNMCGWQIESFASYKYTNGVAQQVGSFDVELHWRTSTHTSNLIWTFATEASVKNWKGYNGTGSLSLSPGVQKGASVSTLQYEPGVLAKDGRVSFTAQYETDNPQTSSMKPSAKIALKVNSFTPLTSPVNVWAPRCDGNPKLNRKGCVIEGNVPTLSVTGPVSYAWHVRTAQATGLPKQLHRTMDDAQVRKNRATACPAKYPRPAGKTCDEYPFASTREGAANSGGGPRTYGGCQINLASISQGPKGYSVCMIMADDNAKGGSDLAKFYTDWRVMDGDAFNVS